MRHNSTHYDHAHALQRDLNSDDGWHHLDDYSAHFIKKAHRSVMVSCPQCEDNLTVWHMFRIGRDGAGRYRVEPA
jgi:hypothetical protein